jgi:hypothetical protein
MRIRSAFSLALGVLVFSLSGGASAWAQSAGYILVDPQRGYVRGSRPVDAYGRPLGSASQPAPPPGRAYPPGYYPGKLVHPAPQQQPGFSLRRLFGIEDEPQPQPVVPYEPPRTRPVRPKPPAVSVARQVKPKVNPSTHVVVFGDALADLTSNGLDDVFAEAPDVAVVNRSRGETGLVRKDVTDWPKAVRDILDSGQKITVGVVMLGAGDRQPIKEGDATYEPLSERWRALYRERVDALVRVFQDRHVPLVWIGLPPMKSEKASADLIAMNEIIRDGVQKAGFTYVDIWPGFVDDENRYSPTGPSVDGQMTRLRANDGVLFTKAGARKVAHFADTEIKRIIDAAKAAGAGAVASIPSDGKSDGKATEGLTIEQLIDASLPAPPELPGTPPLQAKPVAGPVLPLTRPDLAPSGALASGRPRLDNDSAYNVRKALREGVAPSPRSGRADDFKWPRS